ncbi:MAG: CRISPR-associated endonuclease Cas1 [Hyphomicrobiaceae bacterium]|nr:CRISPR-associated endonuclease Cas1 [Hyphomicrobiaceae bacterium]
MSTIFIDRSDYDIDIEGESVVLRAGTERRGTVPLRMVERIVVSRAARLTGRLIARLSQAGIGLMLEPLRHGGDGATVITPALGDGALRIAQYDLALDPAARAGFATGLVRRRIAASAELLAPGAAVDSVVEKSRTRLLSLVAALDRPVAVERLRGMEGAATAVWFEAFARLVPAPFVFAGRNRRPPRDPVNVLLSLGYTLAQFEAVRAAAVAGLDPALGLYHVAGRDRDSLGCDLVEPLRPRVEAWVLALLCSGEIGLQDFTAPGADGCRLLKDGRRRVYRSFEEAALPPVRQHAAVEVAQLVADLRRRVAGRSDLPALPPVADRPHGDDDRAGP